MQVGIVQYLQKRLDLQSISIPPALVEKGKDLAKRWRALTQRLVGLALSNINDIITPIHSAKNVCSILSLSFSLENIPR